MVCSAHTWVRCGENDVARPQNLVASCGYSNSLSYVDVDPMLFLGYIKAIGEDSDSLASRGCSDARRTAYRKHRSSPWWWWLGRTVDGADSLCSTYLLNICAHSSVIILDGAAFWQTSDVHVFRMMSLPLLVTMMLILHAIAISDAGDVLMCCCRC